MLGLLYNRNETIWKGYYVLKSLVNFRDMGGMKTKDGKTVKHKRLLRSGEIIRISEADKEELQNAYQLRHIIDLRSEGEALRAPDDKIDGAVYRNIILYEKKEQKVEAPGEKEFRKLTDRNLVIDFMIKVYEHLITDPHALEGFSELIQVAKNNEEGSLIFHCFAGKDRTGIAAAILYSLLGVSEEDILKEYLLTNEIRREKNEEILAIERAEGKTKEHLAALKVSYEVFPQYLEKVFEVARNKSGSLFGYVKEYMHATDRDIEQLRAMYLE